GGYADRQATDGAVSDSFLAGFSDAHIQSASARTKTARAGTSVSGSFTAPETRTLPAGTGAFIGKDATITAGRHVDVDARAMIGFDMLTGALSVGAVGLGAGVGVASFQNDIQAFVERDATLAAGGAGNVTVT